MNRLRKFVATNWREIVADAVWDATMIAIVITIAHLASASAHGQQSQSDQQLLVQYYDSNRSEDIPKLNALVERMTAEGRMPEIELALDRHFVRHGSSLMQARAESRAAEYVDAPQVYIAQPQPPVLVPAQPVTVATYRPLASFLWGAPTYSYHVAYVLRPPQPPVQQQQPQWQSVPEGGVPVYPNRQQPVTLSPVESPQQPPMQQPQGGQP